MPCTALTTLWSKSFGGTDTDAVGNAVLLETGNLVVPGGFSSTLDFGNGAMTAGGFVDMFLVQLDESANGLWSQSYASSGGLDYVLGWAVDVDIDDGLILGGLFNGTIDLGGGPLVGTRSLNEYDFFVAKLDFMGNHVWSKRLGGGDCLPVCGIGVAAGGFGDIVVSVSSGGSFDFGDGTLTSAGAADMFVASFDPSGNVLWSQQSGGSGTDTGTLRRGPSGHLFLYGAFEGAFDLLGTPVSSAGGSDAFVARLDNLGNTIWLETLPGPGDARVWWAEQAGPAVTVVGQFSSQLSIGSQTLNAVGTDAFVASFDEFDGAFQWANSFGGAGTQVPYFVTRDPQHVLVSGGFDTSFELGGASPVPEVGAGDTFVAIFDSAGVPSDACTFGSSGIELIVGLYPVLDGILFAADFTEPIDFGAGVLTSSGNIDIAIGKFAPLP